MPRRNKRNRRDYKRKDYKQGFRINDYIISGETAVCSKEVKRGEVWYANLGRFDNTSVQRGCRPVLIVSNNPSNEKSGMVTVLPMTTKMKKTWYPSHVSINDSDIKQRSAGQLQPSLILVEQIRTVDKSDLQNRVGFIKSAKMEIGRAHV